MSTTEAARIDGLVPETLVHLPPESLWIRPDQVRKDLGDLTELTHTIIRLGILQPLLINTSAEVLAGQRRRQVAMNLGLPTVPCYVTVEDETANGSHAIAVGLVENERRKALSEAERVEGYTALSLLGDSVKTIAELTGTKQADIKRLVGVGKSDVATAALITHNLTLEQATVFAEFEHDPHAIDLLVGSIATGRFDHQTAYLRQDAKEAKERAALIKKLTKAGVQVFAADPDDENEDVIPDGAWYLPDSNLADKKGDKGKTIQPEDHQDCPERAVFLNWQNEVEELCLDPHKAGHYIVEETYVSDTSTAHPVIPTAATAERVGGELTPSAKEARATVVKNNKAWRASSKVRQEFLRTKLAAAKAPAGMFRFALRALTADPHLATESNEDLIAQLLGVESSSQAYYGVTIPLAVDKAKDPRLPVLLFAFVAACEEQRLSGGQGDGVHNWRDPDFAQRRYADYFIFLSDGLGYVLSEVEQLCVGSAVSAEDEDQQSDEEQDAEDDLSDGDSVNGGEHEDSVPDSVQG